MDITSKLSGMVDSKLVRELYATYVLGMMAGTTRKPVGMNVYDEEWDALIVLDACRVDALREVAGEYSFIESVESRRSVGSTSKEWLLKTFTQDRRDEVENTAYLCSNGLISSFQNDDVNYLDFTATEGTMVGSRPGFNRLLRRNLVSESDFQQLKQIWWTAEYNQIANVPSAETVTDFAIDMGRSENADRFIVHYMQPHAPYIGSPDEDGEIGEEDKRPFDALRDGAEEGPIWEAYLDNLRYVLDHVDTLIDNLDAEKVIITADHGELFGEMGQYGHGVGLPHPAIKRVPWVETSATDTETHYPDLSKYEEDSIDADIQEQLEALGYAD